MARLVSDGGEMGLFNLTYVDLRVILGTRVETESAEWVIDIHGRYDGPQPMDVAWEEQTDYSKLDLDFKGIMEDYKLWNERYKRNRETPTCISPRFGNQVL